MIFCTPPTSLTFGETTRHYYPNRSLGTLGLAVRAFTEARTVDSLARIHYNFTYIRRGDQRVLSSGTGHTTSAVGLRKHSPKVRSARWEKMIDGHMRGFEHAVARLISNVWPDIHTARPPSTVAATSPTGKVSSTD